MDKTKIELILKARAGSAHPPEATVRGVSMYPVLREGDTVSVKKQDEYRVGDVLVYPYIV